MTGPLGTADFFALEAGECLDRLELLLRNPEGPPTDDFLRAARALRGAALLAHQQPVARAASGLEALARAWREGRREWDAAAREHSAQAVEELRLLVRHSGNWTEADSTRASRLALNLEALAGRPGPDTAWADRPNVGNNELQTGLRAFIAREGALIASALDRAARQLEAEPAAREPLYTVLRRMHSLSGLAELSELSPLPEILDGLELALGDLTRVYAPPPNVAQVLDAAAQALTRISRDVAEQGKPTADSPEARRFTDLLLRAFAAEPDVVPIESLYFDDDREPMHRSTTQPQFSRPGPLGPLELVSHGEHLEQSAESIEQAGSATERDLRMYGLVSALRALTGTGDSPMARGLDRFARAARLAIAGGSAASDPAQFTERLRAAGGWLRQSTDLAAVPEAAAALEKLAAAFAGEPVDEAGPVVPIESLAPDEPEPEEVVPIESLAPESEPEWGVLEASFALYSELVATRGLGAASLSQLVGGASAAAEDEQPAPASEPESELAPEQELPVQPSEPVVEIGALCYSGRGALLRAAEVRALLNDRLEQHASLSDVRPLLSELLDLVPLALGDAG